MKQFSGWAAPAVLTVAAVALTACSSSKSGSAKTPAATGAGSSTSQSSASTPASTSASSSAAPGTPLSAIVLQASDVPSTYKKTPAAADDPNDKVEAAKLATCVGGKDTSGDELAKASSNFEQGNNAISSDVSRFKSDADIAADVKNLHSPKIDQCLGQQARDAFTKELPAGAKMDKFSYHVTPGSNGGPSNLAGLGRGTITVTASGQTLQVFVTTAFITGPRLQAEVDIISLGAAIPAVVQQKAIKAVADRAAKG
jgi:hypothetical protein